MVQNSEHGQPGVLPGETRVDSAAAPGAPGAQTARAGARAWTAPRMQRISLQRTLAGSSDASDTHKEISAIPT
jgi:hypothetical protein